MIAATEKSCGSSIRVRRLHNLSSSFLLPIVLKRGKFYKGFINSYLYNSGDDITDYESLYIVLDREDTNITKLDRYITHHTLKDSKWLYKFNIDDFKRDVELFIQGKYSKLSNKLKVLLCSVETSQIVTDRDVYKILYKTGDRKLYIEELIGMELGEDAELCSSPNIEEEIFYEQQEILPFSGETIGEI